MDPLSSVNAVAPIEGAKTDKRTMADLVSLFGRIEETDVQTSFVGIAMSHCFEDSRKYINSLMYSLSFSVGDKNGVLTTFSKAIYYVVQHLVASFDVLEQKFPSLEVDHISCFAYEDNEVLLSSAVYALVKLIANQSGLTLEALEQFGGETGTRGQAILGWISALYFLFISDGNCCGAHMGEKFTKVFGNIKTYVEATQEASFEEVRLFVVTQVSYLYDTFGAEEDVYVQACPLYVDIKRIHDSFIDFILDRVHDETKWLASDAELTIIGNSINIACNELYDSNGEMPLYVEAEECLDDLWAGLLKAQNTARACVLIANRDVDYGKRARRSYEEVTSSFEVKFASTNAFFEKCRVVRSPLPIFAERNPVAENTNTTVVREAVERNTLFLVKNKCVTARAIMLSKHIGVLNNHCAQEDTFEVSTGAKRLGAMVIFRNVLRDVAFFKLKRDAPEFEDITQFLITQSQVEIIDDAYALTLTRLNVGSNLRAFITRPLCLRKHIETEVSNRKQLGITATSLRKGEFYGDSPVCTAPGDCGSATLLNDPLLPACIVGFHAAGNAKTALVSVVTIESYKIAVEQFNVVKSRLEKLLGTRVVPNPVGQAVFDEIHVNDATKFVQQSKEHSRRGNKPIVPKRIVVPNQHLYKDYVGGDAVTVNTGSCSIPMLRIEYDDGDNIAKTTKYTDFLDLTGYHYSAWERDARAKICKTNAKQHGDNYHYDQNLLSEAAGVLKHYEGTENQEQYYIDLEDFVGDDYLGEIDVSEPLVHCNNEEDVTDEENNVLWREDAKKNGISASAQMAYVCTFKEQTLKYPFCEYRQPSYIVYEDPKVVYCDEEELNVIQDSFDECSIDEASAVAEAEQIHGTKGGYDGYMVTHHIGVRDEGSNTFITKDTFIGHPDEVTYTMEDYHRFTQTRTGKSKLSAKAEEFVPSITKPTPRFREDELVSSEGYIPLTWEDFFPTETASQGAKSSDELGVGQAINASQSEDKVALKEVCDQAKKIFDIFASNQASRKVKTLQDGDVEVCSKVIDEAVSKTILAERNIVAPSFFEECATLSQRDTQLGQESPSHVGNCKVISEDSHVIEITTHKLTTCESGAPGATDDNSVGSVRKLTLRSEFQKPPHSEDEEGVYVNKKENSKNTEKKTVLETLGSAKPTDCEEEEEIFRQQRIKTLCDNAFEQRRKLLAQQQDGCTTNDSNGKIPTNDGGLDSSRPGNDFGSGGATTGLHRRSSSAWNSVERCGSVSENTVHNGCDDQVVVSNVTRNNTVPKTDTPIIAKCDGSVSHEVVQLLEGLVGVQDSDSRKRLQCWKTGDIQTTTECETRGDRRNRRMDSVSMGSSGCEDDGILYESGIRSGKCVVPLQPPRPKRSIFFWWLFLCRCYDAIKRQSREFGRKCSNLQQVGREFCCRTIDANASLRWSERNSKAVLPDVSPSNKRGPNCVRASSGSDENNSGCTAYERQNILWSDKTIGPDSAFSLKWRGQTRSLENEDVGVKRLPNTNEVVWPTRLPRACLLAGCSNTRMVCKHTIYDDRRTNSKRCNWISLGSFYRCSRFIRIQGRELWAKCVSKIFANKSGCRAECATLQWRKSGSVCTRPHVCNKRSIFGHDEGQYRGVTSDSAFSDCKPMCSIRSGRERNGASNNVFEAVSRRSFYNEWDSVRTHNGLPQVCDLPSGVHRENFNRPNKCVNENELQIINSNEGDKKSIRERREAKNGKKLPTICVRTSTTTENFFQRVYASLIHKEWANSHLKTADRVKTAVIGSALNAQINFVYPMWQPMESPFLKWSRRQKANKSPSRLASKIELFNAQFPSAQSVLGSVYGKIIEGFSNSAVIVKNISNNSFNSLVRSCQIFKNGREDGINFQQFVETDTLKHKAAHVQVDANKLPARDVIVRTQPSYSSGVSCESNNRVAKETGTASNATSVSYGGDRKTRSNSTVPIVHDLRLQLAPSEISVRSDALQKPSDTTQACRMAVDVSGNCRPIKGSAIKAATEQRCEATTSIDKARKIVSLNQQKLQLVRELVKDVIFRVVPDRSTHYRVLGLDRNACLAEITKAFIVLATVTYPREGTYQENFARVSEAFQVLSDEKLKAVYDAAIKEKKQFYLSPAHFAEPIGVYEAVISACKTETLVLACAEARASAFPKGTPASAACVTIS